MRNLKYHFLSLIISMPFRGFYFLSHVLFFFPALHIHKFFFLPAAQANVHAIIHSEAKVEQLIADIDRTLEALMDIENTVNGYETVLKVGEGK